MKKCHIRELAHWDVAFPLFWYGDSRQPYGFPIGNPYGWSMARYTSVVPYINTPS